MKNDILQSLVSPIIYIPGTFDMFHIGHVRLFQYAHKIFYGRPTVIAGVSSDILVEKYKKMKPIYPLKERLEIVLSCQYVDNVIIQNTFFNTKQLKKYHINYVLLGSDWQGKSFPELTNAQKELGFDIIYKPYTEEVSSSEIKKRIIKNAYEIIEAQTKRT